MCLKQSKAHGFLLDHGLSKDDADLLQPFCLPHHGVLHIVESVREWHHLRGRDRPGHIHHAFRERHGLLFPESKPIGNFLHVYRHLLQFRPGFWDSLRQIVEILLHSSGRITEHTLHFAPDFLVLGSHLCERCSGNRDQAT